jgi:raffinose/stachyose/melibiose transport system permease protein
MTEVTPLRVLLGGLRWTWTVAVLIPLFFVVCLSLSGGTAAGDRVVYLLPADPTLDNYSRAFEFMREFVVALPTVFMNSVVVTTAAVAGALAVSTLAAYAFAIIDFPGRQLLFLVFCLGLVVPTSIMVVPEFLTIRTLGLSGRPALILPYVAFGIALPTLVLTVFFRTLPRTLLDAARVDGSTPLRVLWSVVIPLSRPALGTSALFLFLIFWNEFPLALTLIRDTDQSTLPLAIASTRSRAGTPYEVVAAIMVMASIPVLLAFVLGQRQLVRGLFHGGVKG